MDSPPTRAAPANKLCYNGETGECHYNGMKCAIPPSGIINVGAMLSPPPVPVEPVGEEHSLGARVAKLENEVQSLKKWVAYLLNKTHP